MQLVCSVSFVIFVIKTVNLRAIVCQQPGELKWIDLPEPIVNPGEVLLKIKYVGICGTDLHAYGGNQPYFTYPRILGHELAAEVVELHQQANTDLKPGETVVVIPYKYCRRCFACRHGKTNCCTSLNVLGVHSDGGMQEYISHPPELLLRAPGLNNPEKSIVEPLSIGTHAVDRADIHPDDWIIVSGCGPIGIGILWAAQAKSNRIIALDIDAVRLNFCKKYFDVEHTIMVNDQTIANIREITGGNMAQAVFDATGLKIPMEKAVDYLSPGGEYILVGLNRGDLTFNHPSMHARELSILCSRNATLSDFEKVISRMQKQEFPSDSYITHSEKSSAILTRFDYWKNPANQVIKVMTEW